MKILGGGSTIGINTGVTLQALLLDLEATSSAITDLAETYAWSCAYSASGGAPNGNCPGVALPGNARTWSLPAGALPAGSFLFSVTYTRGVRTVSASTTLSVRSSGASLLLSRVCVCVILLGLSRECGGQR